MGRAGNYRGSGVLETIGGARPVATRSLLVAVLLVGTRAAESAEYAIGIDDTLATLRVGACFEAPGPVAVRGRGTAVEHLKRVHVNGREFPIAGIADGRIPIDAADGNCLDYEVDVRSVAGDRRFPNVRGHAPEVVLMDPLDWLWLPVPAAGRNDFLRVDLPAGMDVSAPWPSAGPRRFHLGGATGDGSSLVAIGALSVHRVPVRGSELRLALVPGSPPASADFVREWVRGGAEAIAGIYGSFPVVSPQVLVVAVGRGGEPVPWGQVQRGGGPAAHLFIDQTRPAAEFAEDWVLVHELGHFLHPDLGEGSAWLSEGLATYYQYVARARAGLLTEQEAWQKLHEGFERGRAQTRDGVNLMDATRSMRERRAFMRVYWTGTAIALLADLALRDAGVSLDEALRRFRDCCLAERRNWDTGEFLERLDALAGVPVLADLARRYQYSDRFPDLRVAHERLGVRAVAGRIELDPATGPASLRAAIMAPRL
jgi:hypothetical protein